MEQIIINVLTRYFDLAGVCNDSLASRRLIEAGRGYAFISTCLIVHAIAASNSLGEYLCPRLQTDKALYDAMRSVVPLKELPSDRVDSATCWMTYFLKICTVSVCNAQFEVVPQFNDDRLSDLDSAKQHLNDLMRIGHDGLPNDRRSLRVVISEYNRIVLYMETQMSGTTAALPQKDPGMVIALTACQTVGTQRYLYTGFPLSGPSDVQVAAFSFFAEYVRRVDDDFVVVGVRAKDNPFNEGATPNLPSLASSWYGAVTIVQADDSALGLMKAFQYEVGPNTLIDDSISHTRVTLTLQI